MVRQLSTSISDFFLACSVFYVAYYLSGRLLHFAAIGLLIQGLAASIGVMRFAMHRPEGTTVFHAHKFLSWLAAAMGMALVSYQFCLLYHAKAMSYIIMSFAAVVTCTSQFAGATNKQLYTQACSGLATLTMLILSALNANWYGVGATLVYILAGAIIGAEGQLLGFQRVDLLHYGLIVGNYLFLKALT